MEGKATEGWREKETRGIRFHLGITVIMAMESSIRRLASMAMVPYMVCDLASPL